LTTSDPLTLRLFQNRFRTLSLPASMDGRLAKALTIRSPSQGSAT